MPTLKNCRCCFKIKEYCKCNVKQLLTLHETEVRAEVVRKIRACLDEIEVPEHDCPHGSEPSDDPLEAADQAVCFVKTKISALTEAIKEVEK